MRGKCALRLSIHLVAAYPYKMDSPAFVMEVQRFIALIMTISQLLRTQHQGLQLGSPMSSAFHTEEEIAKTLSYDIQKLMTIQGSKARRSKEIVR